MTNQQKDANVRTIGELDAEDIARVIGFISLVNFTGLTQREQDARDNKIYGKPDAGKGGV
jgi:hypothetical protein